MAARGRSPGPVSARSAPTPRDCRKYAREFVRTDLDQDGLITAQEAKVLFERSGLGNDVLLRIWDLADVNRMNRLGFKEFIAAMHLIRLALAGQPPPPPPASLPPALVEFLRRFQGRPHDLALEGSSRSASASRSRSATPRGTASRLAPSRRDCRKYAREFQRMDADRDGVLTAEEARAVFLRSGLSNETLGQVFALADRSRNGRLGFVEFVAAMHLIRLTRGGQPPPPSLSPELVNFLGGLQESPAELAREGSSRSASRSRAEPSPLVVAEAAPFSVPPPPPPMEPLAAPSFDAGQSSPFGSSAPLGFESAPQPVLEAQPQLDFPGTGKVKEKKKKDRDRRREPQSEDEARASGSPTRMEPVAFPGVMTAEGLAPAGFAPASSSRSGAFRAPDPDLAQRRSPSTRMGLPMPDLASPGEDFGPLGSSAGVRDPHYAARVREILGLRGEEDNSADEAEVSPNALRYRSVDGSKDGVHGPRRTHTGDYDSPVMWTVLMGAKPALGATSSAARSRAAESAVLPPSSAPFLRTIAPNYRLGDPYRGSSAACLPQRVAPAVGASGFLDEYASRSSMPVTSAQMQNRLFNSSTPSSQMLREQLSALPTAYTSQVPMSV